MIGATSFIRLVFVSVIKRSCNYHKQSLISNIIIQCKYKQTNKPDTTKQNQHYGILEFILSTMKTTLISSSALQFLINIQSLQ